MSNGIYITYMVCNKWIRMTLKIVSLYFMDFCLIFHSQLCKNISLQWQVFCAAGQSVMEVHFASIYLLFFTGTYSPLPYPYFFSPSLDSSLALPLLFIPSIALVLSLREQEEFGSVFISGILGHFLEKKHQFSERSDYF